MNWTKVGETFKIAYIWFTIKTLRFSGRDSGHDRGREQFDDHFDDAVENRAAKWRRYEGEQKRDEIGQSTHQVLDFLILV